jgi:hypothetical protein
MVPTPGRLMISWPLFFTVYRGLGSVISKDILSILEYGIPKILNLHERYSFDSGPDFTTYKESKCLSRQNF